MSLPIDSQARKGIPMARGLLDYFPDALAEVAHVSAVSNEKHNPGEPLHWSKDKSSDHADCLVRHVVERGTIDPDDGLRHSAKAAWRALAMLQIELEAEANLPSKTPERIEDYAVRLPGNQRGIQFGGTQLPTLAELHHRPGVAEATFAAMTEHERAWTMEPSTERAHGGTPH